MGRFLVFLPFPKSLKKMFPSFIWLFVCTAIIGVFAGPTNQLNRYPRDGSSLDLTDSRPTDINDLSAKDLQELKSQKKSSDCVCGARNEEDRIVGGRAAGKSEFPWRCALFFNDPTDGMRLFCGCSVVSNEYVMTAAHCTNAMKDKQIFVDVGDYDITTKDEIENQVLKVAQVIQHEGYDRYKHDWDMSLLKLERPLNFTRNISPVCLPWNLRGETFENVTVVASGSGATEEGAKVSPILRTVDLPVLTSEQCRKYYGNKISDNMLCTYSPGKDTCQGDSGSSIDYKEPSSDSYYALGVVSWGSGCARESKPGVYAKVINFLDWIESKTKGATFCRP